MFFINATLSKNQLYKPKNQPNKQSPYHHSARRHKECVKVPMPAHHVLPLTVYIFEASYSTSATQANKIYGQALAL